MKTVLPLCSLVLLAACSTTGDDDDSTTPDAAVVIPKDGGALPPGDGGSRRDAAVPPQDGGTCTAPVYSTDCSQVPSFQCGFMGTCHNGKISIQWHEHLMCGPLEEQIVNYACDYTCPTGCTEGSVDTWFQSGAAVLTACHEGVDAGPPPPVDAGTAWDAGEAPDAAGEPGDAGHGLPQCWESRTCDAVSNFQCGFMGQCVDGWLYAEWHEHSGPQADGGMDEITSFCCVYQCPAGCTEGTLSSWPASGSALVAESCTAP